MYIHIYIHMYIYIYTCIQTRTGDVGSFWAVKKQEDFPRVPTSARWRNAMHSLHSLCRDGESLDWLKGKSAGNHDFTSKNFRLQVALHVLE